MHTSPYMKVRYYQTLFFIVILSHISNHMCTILSADLLMKLTEETGPDGTVAQIGQIVIDWVRMV